MSRHKDKGKKTHVKPKTLAKGKIPEVDKKQSLLNISIKEDRTVSSILSTKLTLKPNLVVSKELVKEQILNRYVEIYKLSCKVHLERGNILSPKVCDRCCELLNNSRNILDYDIVTVNKLIYIIKKVDYIENPFNLIYLYSNPQTELFRFISEYNNFIENYNPNNSIDIAFRIIFDELCVLYNVNISCISLKKI